MAEFDDWEMLQADEDEMEEMGQGGVAAAAEADGGLMMLRFDHFSIESGTGDASEGSAGGRSVVESDGDNTPSWIDPGEVDVNVTVFRRRDDDGELWSDSGSDLSRRSDCEEENIGLGFVESGDEHLPELENQTACLVELGYESGGVSSGGMEYEGVREVEKMSVVSDDCAEKMDVADFTSEEVMAETEMGVGGEERHVWAAEDGEIGKEVERRNEVEKKTVIWWKVPLELVKFCVFRVSPLWSISVAAAMVGVFLMRRRLQNMKRKTNSLQIKVTVDHKKVDQFMSRAARLNEAFSVVKRVPIIRPSLPAPGVTPWPVMSMR